MLNQMVRSLRWITLLKCQCTCPILFERLGVISLDELLYSIIQLVIFYLNFPDLFPNSFIFQNEPSTMWVNAHGSRTMSALPASTYYGYPGQNQHGAIQQSQQPSHYRGSGYPNFYHSQAGVSQEHQPRSDGTLKASQGPSQQSHQIWQHSYWSAASVSRFFRVL